MDNFTEKDATILDSILKILITNNKIITGDLHLINGHNPDYKISDYAYYFGLLSQYGLIQHGIYSDETFELKPIKIKTTNFICSGGFKNVFDENNRIKLRNIKIDELSLLKLKNET